MSGDSHESRMRKDGGGSRKVSAIEKQGVPKGSIGNIQNLRVHRTLTSRKCKVTHGQKSLSMSLVQISHFCRGIV